MLDSVREIVLCLDADTRIVYANDMAREKLGYDRPELLSMVINDVCPAYALHMQALSASRETRPGPLSFPTYFENNAGTMTVPFEVTIKTCPVDGATFQLVYATEIVSSPQPLSVLDEPEKPIGPRPGTDDFGLIISDPDGYLLEASPYVHKILDYSPGELKGRHFKDIIPPGDLKEDTEYRTGRGMDGAPAGWREKRFIRRDGRIIWATVSTSIHARPDSGIKYFVSHLQESTTRKELEKRLDETGRLFQNAFEDSAVGMIVFDGAGFFVRVNNYLCNLLGYNREELIGKHFVDITHEDDIELSVDSDRRLLNNEVPFVSYEKRYLHKNGYPVWVMVSNSLVYDSKGRPQYFVAHCQDINHRRNVEQRLKESEHRFQLFMDYFPGKAFIKDKNGRYVYGNTYFRRLVESRLHRHVVGLKDQDLYPGSYSEAIANNDQLVLSTRGAVEFIERTPEESGETYWLTNKFPLELDDQKVLLGGIAVDVTNRFSALKELEERDSELEKQKKNLERVNNALKVLMDHRQQEMVKKEQDTAATLRKLVLPYLDMLKSRTLDSEQASILNIALDNLSNVADEFANRFSSSETLLSPTELKVADMLRHGKSSDEISEVLCISPYTVARHRASIRKKMGLTNKKNKPHFLFEIITLNK